MGETALVLGGGGLTGIGWECGMLHGLAESGADLSGADLVVGTSAGSVVGAQLTSGLLGLDALYERQLADPGGEDAARIGAGVLVRFAWGMLRDRDPQAYGARMGAVALSAETGAEADRRQVLAQRLVSHEWPARRLLVTAVDAATGAFRAFDRDSGVPLLDAVGASCAVPGVWPPVTIGDRRWIDGGVRSSANADLAAGYRAVIILAPVAAGAGPVQSARTQAERLRSAGARVLLITPDAGARKAFGPNMLDPARRAAAAEAGRAQAAAHVEEVAQVWSGRTGTRQRGLTEQP
ncbi:patatin-like phospholipase family protein [Streptomyces sp. NPDC006879]|uniref:patatin-like phospholipase family protein n=1 Tax=Streptomyces sp. NPDC006879 TaxID=3364767 RepID=UPI0036A11CCD